ncbi:MAG TPA: hypothetical protein ENG92_04835 [Thiolapillus brandeum]|uniref:Uncharacterized protein n=1 Tax=Thiolapillus brandeum TaxID=1076588 RepID=A0A831KCI3_9GAMM|nr:hypothetical protein [Thiolapillus brandeum]
MILDWEHSREIRLPFCLQLVTGETLCCEENLRILPGRRLVCRATMDGKQVLAKLFLGKDRQREAEQDALGVKAMMAAGILTPALWLESRVEGKGYPILLFDFISRARSFRQSWAEAGENQQTGLLEALLQLVAKQHQAGLHQRDFHLNNFILDEAGQLYAIDGGDFIIGDRPLEKSSSIASLGVLFGHFPQEVFLNASQLLIKYFQQRGWEVSDRILRQVGQVANDFRHRRARRISRKSFRNCSEFMVRKEENLHICQRRDFSPDALHKWLQASNLSPRAEDSVLKRGNSQTVWISHMDGLEVVIKRYNLKNPWHAMRRLFTRSRAAKSWANAHRLRVYHIATPQPLAMIEERWGVFRRRAWLITAKARGVGANHYISDHADESAVKRLAAVVRSFGENGLVHGDMKATNFMMSDESVEVIDLDSMSRPLTDVMLRRLVAKDHKRFLQNWRDDNLRMRFAKLLPLS